ncbi:MAG: sulfatase-like hydrolase/transferase, partial [Cyclobacteriaceae bacterium]|nr:sulfatase-like hydrolase/transferase [Cyclobacteriaceae bacterium]
MKINTLLLIVSLCGFSACSQRLNEKPNILLILVDDMGWSDIGCYGGEVKTPNLDRLAENGIRFTQMHNTSKCFPSRASLLTGVYAQQCGYDKTYKQPIRNAVTIGEVLQTAGYRTLWAGKHHGIE